MAQGSFASACPLIAHFYFATTMANLPSLCNCYHHVYISSWAHHCGFFCNLQWLLWCDCSCRLLTYLLLHLQACGLSRSLLQVRELHCSCSCKVVKCIAIAFVQVCDLHKNCTCNALRFFEVALLVAHGQVSGVYCLGGIFWFSRWKLVVALSGGTGGQPWVHPMPCLSRCNNPPKLAIYYPNVHFNNNIICLVISNWFLSVKLKIN